MTKHTIVVLVALATAGPATMLAGCVEARLTIGNQCDLSTECSAPLACRLGRCRNGCAATRDCDLGTYCTVDAMGVGSCLVPDEASCALDSECPDPLVCRMGRCANECVEDRDCVDGARCEDVDGQMVCLDEGEDRCVDEIDCQAPRICGRFGLCAFECASDRDCLGGTCASNRCVGDVCETDTDCDDGVFCSGAERCDPLDADADARGCVAASDGPCADGELCDPDAQACGPRCDVDSDLDDDGEDAVLCGGGDCDDEDELIRPGASERCDGLDDDCDMSVDEGFDLTTDPSNCGACGTECSGAGGTAACASGACGTLCASGFDDCDGDASNGCEAELASDALNCGSCDNVCPFARDCAASACTATALVEVAAGSAHSCARRSSGGVVCWGDNSRGQLGDGTTTSSSAPVAVVGLVDATAIAAGGDSTCALRAGGRVWCWGANDVGQLADGTLTDRPTPVLGRAPPGAVEVGLGRTHGCVRTASGVIACWGGNADGQLGGGGGSSAAVGIAGIAGGDGLAAGTSATCVTRTGEDLLCVGQLADRMLGATATEIAGTSTLNQVSTAAHHACGVDASSDLYCWGSYVPSATASAPEAPMGATGTAFTGVHVGDSLDAVFTSNFACARTSTASVRCLGSNALGQLGDGTTIVATVAGSSDTLVDVVGISDASDLAVGDLHACAVRATGGVVCWGRNHAGQLGNGATTTDQIATTPLSLAGESSPVDVRDLP